MLGKPYYKYVHDPTIFDYICFNPYMIDIITDNIKYLTSNNWASLVQNPNAIHIIEKNIDIVNKNNLWKLLNYNLNGLKILKNYEKHILWYSNDSCHTKEYADIFRKIISQHTIYHSIKYKISKYKYHWLNYFLNKIDIEDNKYYAFIYNWLYSLLQRIDVEDKYHDFYKIYWTGLSGNKYAIDILEQNINKIDWKEVCKNENVVKLFKKINYHKYDINWSILSSNPNAIPIIEKNLDKVCWHGLSKNPNAIHILEKNLDKVDWHYLSGNKNAITILKENLDKVDWYKLSSNPNAIHILEKNIDKLCWYNLSLNENAIHILEQNMDKVHWINIFINRKTYNILKNYKHFNYDGLKLASLLTNREDMACILFGYDYDKMKNNMMFMNEELVEYIMNPSRLLRLCKQYNITFEELLEYY